MRTLSRLLMWLALASCGFATPASAADKPLVIESGKIKQLPASTTLQVNASGTGAASINIPHGTAPTSPNNGDCWTTTGGLFCRVNGGTVGPYGTGTGSGSVTTSGSPASGNLTKFSGATAVTNGDLSGDVTTSGALATTIANDAVTTAKINDSAVTLAKIANAAANSKLVGSGAAGSGAPYTEITIGSGLTMTGTTLSSSGGGLAAANNLSDVASASTSRTNLGVGTGDSPQFTGINLGHASDTTLTRTGAGDIAVEGNALYRAGGTDVPVTDGGTGASSASSARTNLGLGTIAVEDEATAAQIQAATASKAVAADKLIAAAAPQTLTDGATINWDMHSGFNAKVTLGGNRTFATPTNPHEGMTYRLEVIQDGTGNRTATWPSAFDFGSAGTPTLSTTAAKHDFLYLDCYDASTPKFRVAFNKAS
jgi:hypothetical protein